MLEGYREIYAGKMTEEELKKEVDEIMARLDIDRSGNIDYTEWAVGTINKADVLSTEKLKKAFNLFDKDNSGSISAEEVRMVLGVGTQIGSEEVWKEIIGEVDANGDGEISFLEFETMMRKILSSSEEEEQKKNLIKLQSNFVKK
mmetsp:Transcript_7685/g.5784  ORF Transcript_7685/g.5784 Transcript_7685/m.5784 type:complete len:145 (+) Transcript_7685:1150-1584(+)